VFFLHHTQLDRLWWKWQTLHPEISTDYDGVTAHHMQERASLDDVLRMGGLAPDVAVAEIIDTHSGLLRYRY
jgi:tyrosinase